MFLRAPLKKLSMQITLVPSDISRRTGAAQEIQIPRLRVYVVQDALTNLISMLGTNLMAEDLLT